MNIPIELNLWLGACVLAALMIGPQRPNGTAPLRSISAVDSARSTSAADSARSISAVALVWSISAAGSAPANSISAVDSASEQPTSYVGWRSFAYSRMKDVAHGLGLAADTLLHEVRAGDVLIIDLPEELDGRVVTEYSLVHAPALSWLVDYSLMWRTMPADSGRHDIVVRADSPVDTLVVSILVR